MKLAVFLVLVCLGVCYVHSVKIYTWGRITNRTLGTRNVVVPSSMFQVKNYTFTYPDYMNNPYPIHGVTHMDFKSHPTSVRFLRGGIGQRNVTLEIISQRGHGINSTFIFYTL